MRFSVLGKFLLGIGIFFAGAAAVGMLLGFVPWLAPFIVGLVFFKFIFVLAAILMLAGGVAWYYACQNHEA
ncbi:MAG: hypothetical protein NUW01_12370 [Gemmatimonadaceae bacterium]|jgi:hypothetical protein|nr:hypothetical protein [Gemmatimonadaceae bacterium]